MKDYCIFCGADVSDLGTQVCSSCRDKTLNSSNKEQSIKPKSFEKSRKLSIDHLPADFISTT